ncbi:hypothetical protein NDNC_1020 [Candidatus Nasuia deltocephalinicola]|uniref:50S ribosomal protein L6 n=1 Tax=Candidatus Nasuia deltocephalincola TaxID=1160784 RepID=A0A975A3P2_9PROT|nr:50S ribosomal protein L6 [Candidatus Nasuia deltocephalinicola]BEH03936.1 hypothetical protein NDNC_1020 [Candidatus Nasuia deltocephalinicola]
MFFKKRYFRISRFSKKFLFLFNLFFNFNKNCFEFLGFLGIYKIAIFLNFLKNGNFIKIYSLFLKNLKIGFIFSILNNIIKGLIFNYFKKLVLFGLGYKVFLRFNYLYFYLSYSHPKIYKIPSDVTISINSNEILVSCINKQRLGEVCLFLKNFKKPDSYKGKGIRYFNEKFTLKLIKKK